MTNLDWYERVIQNLPQELYDVCETIEQLMTNGFFHLYTSKLEKHPTISVVVSFGTGEYNSEPIIIHFDPFNQEFYTIVPEEFSEVRLMLRNDKEIINFIHEQVHIAEMAYEAGEDVMDFDGNEQNGYHLFLDMIQSFSDNGIHVTSGETSNELGHDGELFHELISDNEIDWFTKDIVTNSVNNIEQNLQQVTTIRLGKFLGTETYVLGRVDTVTINGAIESEHGGIFPFEKTDIAALQELLSDFQP